MPATSSSPGSYSQTAQSRGAKKVARRAIQPVAHATAQAVTAGAGTAVVAAPVSHATALGYAHPTAPSYEAAQRAERQVQRQARRARAKRQQSKQIQRTLSDSRKASKALTQKTAELTKQIQQETGTKVKVPKVVLADTNSTSQNKLGVTPKLAKAILQEKPVAQAKVAKKLAKQMPGPLPQAQQPQRPQGQPQQRAQQRQQVKQQRRKAIRSIPDIGNSREVAPLVQRQAKKHGIPPSVLMAQIQNESNFDPSAVSSVGARGETQFMPDTAPGYGVHFGTSPKAVRSQIKGQAKFMGELLQSKGNLNDALAGYNAGPNAPVSAAGTYPQDILKDAADYAALDKGQIAKSKPVPKKTVTRFEAIVDEAKKIDSAKLTYSLGAGHVSGKVPGPSKTQYDCSSAVSRVLQAAGYDTGGGAQVSGYFENFGKPGPGAVTIYANADHVFMRIGNRYWGTSHANPGGGPGFIPTSYEQGEAQSGNYVVRHVPGLGRDIARRMGIRLTPGGTPGLSPSSSGTTATITDGVIRDTPGASSKPIKVDPKTLPRKLARQKAKRQEGKQRSKFIRSLISDGSQPVQEVATPTTSSDFDAYLNRKVSIPT